MTSRDPDLLEFKPLHTYKPPSMPTEEAIRRLLRQARLMVGSIQDEPFKSADLLERTAMERLDDIVAPPACGKLLREFQVSVSEWVADPAPPSWLYVVVLPPCDGDTVLQTWAGDHGHDVMRPPERTSLLSGEQPGLAGLDGRGILVIPQLERWFVRHRNGLAAVRSLLSALQTLERHCVVGCGSWAWALLASAVNADTMLPPPQTFQAFDATRLSTWFSELAASDNIKVTKFRLSGTGENVLALDEDGKLTSNYMMKLAARSLGIPWVAWHLWRTSLRSERPGNTGGQDGGEAARAAADDTETLWIAALEEFSIPLSQEQDVLLVLQALLLHGSLTGPELELVLPSGTWQTVVPVMLRARLVERDGPALTCSPAAYPAMRDRLAAAGFSMDAF